MEAARTILAVDLGGTKLAVAVVDDSPRVLARSVAPTVVDTSRACLDDLRARLQVMLAQAGPVAAIGIGIASMVRFPSGRIVESTNLPLRDVPLRSLVAEWFGLPAAVDNDATAAGIAEHRWGAGVGVDDMLMLTLGTGIGGCIICDGRPYRGHSGAAGELGHMVIDLDGPRCKGGCPNSGCLEVFASGSSLDAAALAEAGVRPDSALGRAQAAGDAVNGPLLTRLARAGDADALAVFERVGTLLGVGITNLVNIFNPELVIVGGGVMEAGDLLLAPARRAVAERGLRPHRDEVRIVPARFGQDAGLIGAAALAFDELAQA
jgi:glucokinase